MNMSEVDQDQEREREQERIRNAVLFEMPLPEKNSEKSNPIPGIILLLALLGFGLLTFFLSR